MQTGTEVPIDITSYPRTVVFTNTVHVTTKNNLRSQTFSSPSNALVKFIKTRLKLGRLLQHVSVYKETTIREPVSA